MFGAGGEPLVQYEGSGTSTRSWLHADERGSVIALSNGNGEATAINSYDEYGIPAAGNAGRFQYTGQAWLPELSMYHYRARAYSPTLGRFMQTDPIGYAGGMNLYAYVGNEPINHRDPAGTDLCGIDSCYELSPFTSALTPNQIPPTCVWRGGREICFIDSNGLERLNQVFGISETAGYARDYVVNCLHGMSGVSAGQVASDSAHSAGTGAIGGGVRGGVMGAEGGPEAAAGGAVLGGLSGGLSGGLRGALTSVISQACAAGNR